MVTAPVRHTLIILLLLLAALASFLSSRAGLSPKAPVEGAAPATLKASATHDATLSVEMTAYTSEVAQTDDTPNLTASGARVAPGIAAASRDLLGRFPYGTHVEVLSVSGEGCGGWVPETPLTVADTMHPRIENHIDVWLESNELALAWGRCEAEVRAIPEPVE